jgi:hypothetical protein
MPKICYISNNFHGKSLILITRCNEIIREYQKDGYKLTLRQLYYQLVSRDIIPNKQASYNMIGNLINDARLAGLIDWDTIEDRTRNLKQLGHWYSPEDIIASCAYSFKLDKWKDQTYRPEVWIEKDALAGVAQRVCNNLDIPYFSCRGYTSQSEMWGAAMRFVQYNKEGQIPFIIHLGDHDPSGIDMSRDIQERIKMFMQHHGCMDFEFERIALNMDQIREYDPPPNPAKSTDSRFQSYLQEFGEESWELDALEPNILHALITDKIDSIIEHDKFDALIEEEKEHKNKLQAASDHWDEVVEFLENK